MHARLLCAFLVSVTVLFASVRDAHAVCTIDRPTPTGTIPAPPSVPRLGQAFRFNATDDCVTLAFTVGAYSRTPVQGRPRGSMVHTYNVPIRPGDWATLTAGAITFTWTVTGTDAAGNVVEVTITNELDLDYDGVTRSAGDCDDANPAVGGPTMWWEDEDGDGDGGQYASSYECTAPPGFVATGTDCDDTDPSVNGLREDECYNGIDDDCTGAVDDCLLDAMFVVEGVATPTGLGSSVAVADFDGDDDFDLLVGVPWLGATPDAAYANVFYGPAQGTQTVESDYLMIAPAPGGVSFGTSVTGSDLDGDGYDDAVVGTPGISRVYTFWGPIYQAFTFPAGGGFQEPGAYIDGGAYTGTDVDVVADHDGDGGCDLVIGATGAGGGGFDGATYVLPCHPHGDIDLTTDATITYTGDFHGTMGYANTSVGDANGDGLSDLVFGDSGSAVYLVNGGLAPGAYYAVDEADGQLGATLASTTLNGYFGQSVVPTDFDQDGHLDLLVGAPEAYSSTGAYSGLVYLFIGPFDGAVVDLTDAWVVWESQEVAGLGWGGIAATDGDGDGFTDIFLGGPEVGEVYVQRDDRDGLIDVADLATLRNVSSGGELGSALAFVPDWDGDGQPELAVGATNATNAAYEAVGKVYVLSSELAF